MIGITYPLPNDYIVKHGASAQNDSHTDHYAGSDGRSGRKLEDGVEDDICK